MIYQDSTALYNYNNKFDIYIYTRMSHLQTFIIKLPDSIIEILFH